MYLVFTRMPGEIYRGRLRSLLRISCLRISCVTYFESNDVFNSLVC